MRRQETLNVSPVEIIRSIYDAYESGDLGAAGTHFADDAVGYISDFLPWGGYRHGKAEMNAGLKTLRGYISTTFEPDELIDSRDHVIAVGRTIGLFNATMEPFSVRTAHVWHFEASKIVRFENYLDRAFAALIPGAVTLEEPPPVSPVEIVRSMYDAYEAEDRRAMTGVFDPDIEVYAPDFLPSGGTRHGLRELREGLDIIRRHITTAFEPDEIIDAGDHIVAVGHTVGMVNPTTQQFSVRMVHVLRFAGEKIVRFETYPDQVLADLLHEVA